jgi:hypothetical protein
MNHRLIIYMRIKAEGIQKNCTAMFSRVLKRFQIRIEYDIAFGL